MQERYSEEQLAEYERLMKSVYGDFYREEHPEEKRGIGHECEHIKGVIHRTDQIIDTLKGRIPDEEMPDKLMADAVAVLHDMGNPIGRDAHNHYAYGIIKGDLTIEDIAAVPNKYMTPGVAKNILEGKDLDEEDSGKAMDVIEQFQEIYASTPKYAAVTESLRKIFTPEQLDVIAKAVQDHNIDYRWRDTHRYEARNIYGMIAADADKDNVYKTFGLRTLAFAINHFGTKMAAMTQEERQAKGLSESPMLHKDGSVNISRCAGHILDQSFERAPGTIKKADVFVERIMDYKDSIEKIKGVILLEKPRQLTEEEDAEKGVAPQPLLYKGQMYTVRAEEVDTYSQLDAKYPQLHGAVLGLRRECIEKLHAYADPDRIEEHTAEIEKEVVSVYRDAPTLEAAVDRVEMEYYARHGITIKDPSWNAVIENMVEKQREAQEKELPAAQKKNTRLRRDSRPSLDDLMNKAKLQSRASGGQTSKNSLAHLQSREPRPGKR